MNRKRIFSGIRPTGEIHLGNYFGALRNWVDLMHQYDCVYGVVDYHAITTPFEAKTMPQMVFNTMAALIAVGLDAEKCMMMVQSDVPEHTELAWILSCLAPLGQMERMTQFKEKSQQDPENINLGLLAYPALMAADILIYRADVVPVGDDQVQHLELTRDLARKFNNAFGDYFPEPQPLLTPTPRIMGLDGKAKMSKTLNNHISLFEESDVLQQKIMTAVTDENRKRRNDPGNPDICNIFSLHNIYSKNDEVQMIDRECRVAGIGCVDCKKILHGHLETSIAPFRDRYKELHEKPDEVRDIAREGAKRCLPIAQETLQEVKSRLGIGKHQFV
ncbi:MAG: tryptophan--tRNA ligase [Candidatus Omnitrophota bacterium]|jgi:tryptophanyl-tRNA synthetase|nr:MAG: tryptophan--tRNA ligase [Candidatus Omnitrophota bacterium]